MLMYEVYTAILGLTSIFFIGLNEVVSFGVDFLERIMINTIIDIQVAGTTIEFLSQFRFRY